MKRLLSFFLILLSGCSIFKKSSQPVHNHKPCGEAGSIQQRIRDCAQTKSPKMTEWKLVTRTSSHNEVWMDAVTHTIWSDDTGKTFPFSTLDDLCQSDDSLAARGGLKELSWRPGSFDDFAKSETHGLRDVHAHITHMFWTSTPSQKTDHVYLYDGKNASLAEGDITVDQHHLLCTAKMPGEN